MVRSMTAFARAEAEGLAWEIRSVNQRYLDTSFRLPERFRSIELDLRALVKTHLHRGKVDCYLRLESGSEPPPTLEPNEEAVAELKAAVEQVSRIMGISSNVSPLDILRWPGVVQEQETVDDTALSRASSLLEDGLQTLIEMREREGKELAEFIEARLDETRAIVTAAREEAPQINKRLEARLRERLESLKGEVDNGRLEQELIYMAQKTDILEELDRLDTHIEEVRNTLNQSGPVGRRLDFLMQELNREANTLSSKAVAANTSLQAVELKVLIEQMREQIQNIE